MSDNDLISRSHFDDRVRLAAGPDADLEYSADFLDGIKVVLYMLGNEPAVPHEMSAREFVREHHRMCQSKMKCVECRICHDDGEPRSCAVLMGLSPDDTVAVVEQWAREHSEERSEQ